MAFKSQAQQQRFQELVNAGKMKQSEYDKHASETKLQDLPERLTPKKPKPIQSTDDLRNIYKDKFNGGKVGNE